MKTRSSPTPILINYAAVLLCAFALARPAAAQTREIAPAKKVYSYVEQMPQLPGGGGGKAIVDSIAVQLLRSEPALKEHLPGRVFLDFTVGEDGLVRDAKIVKGLDQDCDKAVLRAVQFLPRFIPGKQSGRSVAVAYTIPITFPLQTPKPPQSK